MLPPLIIPTLLLAGAPAPDMAEKDRKLVAAVRVAAARDLAPNEAERAVGMKAVLNTSRERDRWVFTRADIVADPDHEEALPARDSIRWAAYWVRNVESRNPKLVGIYWPKEGRPKVFFGELLPP
jgi:hypothetical protein